MYINIRYGPQHIRSLAFENQTIKVVTENDMLFQEELARLRNAVKIKLSHWSLLIHFAFTVHGSINNNK